MNSLTKLNLHGLKIPKGSSLKGLFKDLHSLQTLTLTGSNTAKGNFLAPIHPGSLRNLKQLKCLILQQSTLTLLHEKVFSHLANLEEMYLQFNRITHIQYGSFSNQIKLESLNLGQNNISSIDNGVFKNLTKLKFLYMWSNQFSFITNGLFSGLFNLKWLNLENNQINKIDHGAFADLNNISHLDLSENNLYYLEKDIFEGLHNIKRIDFSGNYIFDIEKGSFSYLHSLAFRHFPEKINIFLADNSIQEIRWDIFVGYNFSFQNLHHMHLDLNYLNCTRSLCWMDSLNWRIPINSNCQENLCPAKGEKSYCFHLFVLVFYTYSYNSLNI